jgi:hypothetical protein
MECADSLHAELMKYYDAVLGPGLCYEVEAIQRLLASESSVERRLPGMSAPDVHRLLNWAFPQKCAYIGAPAIDALIEKAGGHAERLGLGVANQALVAATLFMLGHGCFEDPQYPWIATALRIETAPTEAALYRAIKNYLQVSLPIMERC